VFLFDEPLSNLDAALRTEMRAELASLHRRNQTTSIYVTHDQVEAMTLGSRIAVLHDGVLQQVDTPLALYERPVNQFVAGFIGTPCMNFVEGTVEGHQDGLSLRAGDRWWDLPRATWEGLTRGERATLGVRPQRVDIGSKGLRANVELVEPMGWDAHLHCRLGDTTVVAQAAAHAIVGLGAGDAVTLQIESRDTFVFNSVGKTVAYAEAR
jgi:multiple sugar transport system ATP-binding protein